MCSGRNGNAGPGSDTGPACSVQVVRAAIRHPSRASGGHHHRPLFIEAENVLRAGSPIRRRRSSAMIGETRARADDMAHREASAITGRILDAAGRVGEETGWGRTCERRIDPWTDPAPLLIEVSCRPALETGDRHLGIRSPLVGRTKPMFCWRDSRAEKTCYMRPAFRIGFRSRLPACAQRPKLTLRSTSCAIRAASSTLSASAVTCPIFRPGRDSALP